MSRENLSSEFPTRSDTNCIVQPQKMAGVLKFRIYKVEGLHYLCSKNKGADQLRGYRTADLRLCFPYAKSGTANIVPHLSISKISNLATPCD